MTAVRITENVKVEHEAEEDGGSINQHFIKQIKKEPDAEIQVQRTKTTGWQEEANENLAHMIAHGHMDVVKDKHFRGLVRCLDHDFKLPSREEDMEKMCDDILTKERKKLLSSLKRPSPTGLTTSSTQQGAIPPGRVSLSVGKVVTTTKVGGREATTTYTACNFIDGDWNLHRVVADANMESERLMNPVVVLSAIQSHGLLNNILMMVGDEHDGIQSILKEKIYSNLPESARPLSGQLFCSTPYMDSVLHSVARCFVPCASLIQMNLLKLSAQQTCPLVLSHPGQQDPRAAYSEQWYSLYCLLKIHQDDHSTTEATGLMELLCRLWGSIHNSIQLISDSTSPTSHLCLEELLKLRKIFQDEVEVTGWRSQENAGVYGKSVKDVLREALQTIDTTIRQSYLVWSIPCILDPRCNLKGVQDMFGKAYGKKAAAGYIRGVEEKIEELYTLYRGNDSFDQGSLDFTLGEYEDFDVKTPPEYFEILKWWKCESSGFRTLGRMARDFLAMPTCSKLSSKQTAHVRSIIRARST